jgi:hypothetical protein
VALAADCESLTSLKLKDAAVTSANLVAAGAFIPPEGPANGPYKTLPQCCSMAS